MCKINMYYTMLSINDAAHFSSYLNKKLSKDNYQVSNPDSFLQKDYGIRKVTFFCDSKIADCAHSFLNANANSFCGQLNVC